MAEAIKTAVKSPVAIREAKALKIQGSGQPGNYMVEEVLRLQRTIGNHAVSRLISSGSLQEKLKVGMPGDIFKKEADRAAEQGSHEHAQKRCPGCALDKGKEENKKLLVQTETGNQNLQFQVEKISSQSQKQKSCKNIEFVECIKNMITQKEAMIKVYTNLAKKWGIAFVNTESGERVPLDVIDFSKLKQEFRTSMLVDLLEKHRDFSKDEEAMTSEVGSAAGCGFAPNAVIEMYTDEAHCEIHNAESVRQAMPCKELFDIAQMHEVFHATKCEERKGNRLMLTPAGKARGEIQAYENEISELRKLLEGPETTKPSEIKKGSKVGK